MSQETTTLVREPLFIDDYESEFNTAAVYCLPETDGQPLELYMDVYPNKGVFDAFRVPVKPEEVQKALKSPQSYGSEAARILLTDMISEDEEQPA